MNQRIGAHYLGDQRCEFTVWAPFQTAIAVEILTQPTQIVPLQPQAPGYWQVTVEGVTPGTHYRYRLNDQASFADPASQFQPQGVHGPSEVTDPHFDWTDQTWHGCALDSLIVYELHVGTFTPEGTFAAIIPRLPELKELGITAIELMPIAQFSGDAHTDPNLAYRNWGYDGVYPFAVQCSYGTPQALKQLVDACHQQGIAVILDVVYNHFGPEGNYSGQFGPYITEAYSTPWGGALNFDQADSVGVRNYFIQNALYWLRDFHIDALRLDAVHAIYDFGAKHILQELAEAIAALSEATGISRYLIAESDLNDPRLIRPARMGGYGLDAQWSDDFHHALHCLLTGDRDGYYSDFGLCADLAKAYEDCFVYDWKYSPFRRRLHGMPCGDRAAVQFAVCSQNHDQIGNRMLGERLTERISFEGLKLAAAAVLLSPFMPLLFMGEEYGEIAPFLYFVSHADPALIQAVRAGRQREFEAFHQGEVSPPDPEAVETFLRCKLNWDLRQTGKHKALLAWYQRLISLRRSHPVLQNRDRACLKATCEERDRLIRVHRWTDSQEWLMTLNFGSAPFTAPLPTLQTASKQLDSADTLWAGPGSRAPELLEIKQPFTVQPMGIVVYELARPI